MTDLLIKRLKCRPGPMYMDDLDIKNCNIMSTESLSVKVRLEKAMVELLTKRGHTKTC